MPALRREAFGAGDAQVQRSCGLIRQRYRWASFRAHQPRSRPGAAVPTLRYVRPNGVVPRNRLGCPAASRGAPDLYFPTWPFPFVAGELENSTTAESTKAWFSNPWSQCIWPFSTYRRQNVERYAGRTMDRHRGSHLEGWRVNHDRNPVALAPAVVLPGRGTLVIMEACALSSRQRAASTACAILPLPGIVG